METKIEKIWTKRAGKALFCTHVVQRVGLLLIRSQTYTLHARKTACMQRTCCPKQNHHSKLAIKWYDNKTVNSERYKWHTIFFLKSASCSFSSNSSNSSSELIFDGIKSSTPSPEPDDWVLAAILRSNTSSSSWFSIIASNFAKTLTWKPNHIRRTNAFCIRVMKSFQTNKITNMMRTNYKNHVHRSFTWVSSMIPSSLHCKSFGLLVYEQFMGILTAGSVTRGLGNWRSIYIYIYI